MRFQLTITYRDGSDTTTTGEGRDNLLIVSDLIAHFGFKESDAEFTITAERGLDIVARFGDVASASLEVTM